MLINRKQKLENVEP